MKKIFALCCMLLIMNQITWAQLSGTKTIGPGGDYITLTAAFNAIAAGGLSGHVILSLQSGYSSASETFPLTPPSIATAAASITVRPAVAGLSIASANTSGTFSLDGVFYFIVDGRVNGVGNAKDLSVSNSSTSGCAFLFINGASHNIIRYCNIQGVNNSVSSGVIKFFTSTAGHGNNYNLIDYCDIHNGLSRPVNGIYSAGEGADLENSFNTVSNCNIYDYHRTSGDMSGVLLGNYNKEWTISGNSFYQTASRNISGNYFLQGIASTGINNGNLTISANYFGGSAPLGGGGAMTITGAGGFKGIRLSVSASATASVQGNVIRNISLTSSSSSKAIAGISLVAGSFDCGNITPNIIGSSTGMSISLSLSGGSGPVFSAIGAGTGSGSNVNISDNLIGGIEVSGSAYGGLTGIGMTFGGTSSADAYVISGNTIGFATAPLINACNSTSGNNTLYGISSDARTLLQTISYNTIQFLSYTGTGTNNQLAGIRLSPSTTGKFITFGNIVADLSSASTATGGGASASLIGICQYATTTPDQQIFNNTIYNLTNTASSAAVAVSGIYYNGPGTGNNYISGNFIHSLKTLSSASGSAHTITGIYLGGGNSVSGSVRAFNNMIRLGIDASGSSLTTSPEITGLYRYDGVLAAYFNSIYIGGTTAASAAVNTYGVKFRDVTFPDTLVNNILVNNRSNNSPGSGGKHFSFFLTNAALHYSNFNIYQAAGIDGIIATINGSTPISSLQALWEALPERDLNSGIGDPNFVNPTGPGSIVNLHVQSNTPAESCGVQVPGITTDFDGSLRSLLSPQDIGADAGNYSNTASDIFYPRIIFNEFTAGSVAPTRPVGGVYITDQGAGVNNNSGSRPRIYYKKSSDATTTIDYTNNPSIGGWKWVEANNTISPYNFTINYAHLLGGSVIVGDVIQYFIVAQDLASPVHLAFNPTNGTSGLSVSNLTSLPSAPKSYIIKVSVSGTKIIGGSSGYDYANLTGPTGLFQDINAKVVTGNITAVISGNLLEPATHALNQWIENGPPEYTLTIRSDGAALRTITNSVNLSSINMIRFNGADRVTIDGGASKLLLFRNTNTNNNEARSPLHFDNGAVDCNVTNTVVETNAVNFADINLGTSGGNILNISYCELRNATAGTLGQAKQGIFSSNPLNRIIALNNNIYNFTDQGIYLENCANRCQISGNSFFYNQLPLTTAQIAIQVNAGDNHIISGNYIGGSAPNCSGEPWKNRAVTAVTGIWFKSDISQNSIDDNTIANISMITDFGYPKIYAIYLNSGTVRKNKIYDLGAPSSAASLTVYGIYHDGLAGITSEFSNNMISLDGGNAVNPILFGFYGNGATTAIVQLYYNSIYLHGPADNENTFCLFRVTTTISDVRNNLLINKRVSSGGSKHYAIALVSNQTFTSNYNDLVSDAGPIGLWNGNDYYSLAAWNNNSGQDNNSITVSPVFVSNNDLHLLAGNCYIDGKGTPIAGITADIDANLRDVLTPDPGCDEFTSVVPAVPLTDLNPTGCDSDAGHLLSASGSGTIIWYTDAGLSNQVFSGSPYNTSPLAAGSYTFYVTDSVSGCESPAVAVTLTIDMDAVPGSVTPDRTICSGQTSGLLSLGSFTGTVVKWQYAIAPFSAWNDITFTGTSYTSGPLTQTTQFRGVLKSGVCDEVFSTFATITVLDELVVTFEGTLASQCSDATSYQLSGGSPAGGTYSGPGVSGTNFSAAAAGLGTHTITYTINSGVGCSGSATNTITVTPLPGVYSISGSGSYCSGGSGLSVNLPASQPGVSYQLEKNGLDLGPPQSSGGGPINWTNCTAGVYTVTGTITATDCSAAMAGIVTITEDPPLSAVITPDPAEVVLGENLNLNGNPSGGTITYSTHNWTGTAAVYLNNTSIVNPVFSTSVSGTYYLTYTVTDSHGCTASDDITISTTTILAVPQMGNQVRCGTGSVTMVAAIGMGGDQVQFSLDGSSVVFTASAPPYQYLTPVIPSGEILVIYARTRNSISGITSGWISATATAFAPSAGGTVNGGGTICQGSSTGILSLTGFLGNVIQWQKNLNGGAWTDIPNTTAFYSEIPSSAGTWQYRAVVQNGVCSVAYSSLATLVVTPSTQGGSLSGSGVICLGSPGGIMTLTNYVGYIEKWQEKYENGAWTDIVNPLPYYSVTPSAAGVWFYRVYVTNGVCGSAYSTIASITVTATPVVFTLSGPSTYCDGVDGVTLSLSGSETGVNYQLKKDGLALGDPVPGTGQPLSWNNNTEGSYQVIATKIIANCTAQMEGVVTVIVLDVPMAYIVSSSAYDCGGNGGGMIFLSGSEPGITYQLYHNGIPAFMPKSGNGDPLEWGDVLAGNYTVMAVNPATFCSTPMTGSGVVSLADLPLAFTVTGGGQACANTAGVPVGLSGSQTGVVYTLFLNEQPLTANVMNGTGQALDFGYINQPGSIYVIAENVITACSNMMNQTVTVTLLEVPQVDAGPDVSIPYGTGIYLDGEVSGGQPPYQFLWSPGSTLSDSTILNPYAVPYDTVTYWLLVSDANGCNGSNHVSVYPFLPPGQSAASGRVTYANLIGSPLPNVTVFLKDAGNVIIAQAVTESDGTFFLPPFPNGSYTLSATSNQPAGGINSTDALEVLKHFVQYINLTGLKRVAADADGSNYVNSVDALTIQYFFVGLINSFPPGPWAFEKKPYTFNNDAYFLTLQGICTGDANASFIPFAKTISNIDIREEGVVVGNPGEIVSVPFTIRCSALPAAVSLDITVDHDCFTPLSIGFPEGNENWVWNIRDKRISLSAAATDGLKTNSGDITFLVSGKVIRNDTPGSIIRDAMAEIADKDGKLVASSLIIPIITPGSTPDDFALDVYPNPAREKLGVSFSLPVAATVKIELSDPRGGNLFVSELDYGSAGAYKQFFDIQSFPAGLYLIRATMLSQDRTAVISRKLVLINDK